MNASTLTFTTLLVLCLVTKAAEAQPANSGSVASSAVSQECYKLIRTATVATNTTDAKSSFNTFERSGCLATLLKIFPSESTSEDQKPTVEAFALLLYQQSRKRFSLIDPGKIVVNEKKKFVNGGGGGGATASHPSALDSMKQQP